MPNNQKATDDLLSQLRRDDCSLLEIVAVLKHEIPILRANALLAILPRAEGQDALVGELTEFAEDPQNSTRIMGMRLANLAIACLLAIGTPKSEGAAVAITKCWTQGDRYDAFSWTKRLDLMEPHDLASYNHSQKAARERINGYIRQNSKSD